MVHLKISSDFLIEYHKEHGDISVQDGEACITLALNNHWRKLLELPENDEKCPIQIVTKRFSYSPVPSEQLIDLHSVAFSLIYLSKRFVELSATEDDTPLGVFAIQSRELHTWPQAMYSPIAFAAEFLESLSVDIDAESDFPKLQRAWLLPIMHMATIGRPKHINQGNFLFPLYRALMSPVSFFNTAAYTEAAGRRAAAQLRQGQKDSVMSTDSRVVSLLKQAAAKESWEPSDAVELGNEMAKVFCFLTEYTTHINLKPKPYKAWDDRVRHPERVRKHHLALPGKVTESEQLLSKLANRERSKAQALKKSDASALRLELLPETPRKRGCPDNYDVCRKDVPESPHWNELVKAMKSSDIQLSDQDIDVSHAKAEAAGLWGSSCTLTKQERQIIYRSMVVSPPMSLLQRIIVFGAVETETDAQKVGDDNKENRLTYTTNKALAMENTGSKVLDFFMANKQSVKHLIANAWEADPVAALKILFYHRSITEGKGNAAGFYGGAQWVYHHHFRTFLWNLPSLAFTLEGLPENDPKMTHPFGYWKDLLEMLKDWVVAREKHAPGSSSKSQIPKWGKKAKLVENNPDWSVQLTPKRDPEAWKALLDDAYSRDEKLLHFHDVVAFLFAIQLKRDLFILERHSTEKDDARKKTLRVMVSLAGKWAPTPRASHDRSTYIATSIARLLYPEMPASTKDEIEALRWHYRCNCLKPLRQLLDLPELKITTQQYETMVLKSVPSRALQRYSDCIGLFAPHLVENNLKRKAGLNASHVNPQKIIAALSREGGDEDESRVLKCVGERTQRPKYQYSSKTMKQLLEAQWTEFVKSMRDVPGMEKCVALCDVSGSMSNSDNSMDWAIAFSLLISELCTGPFKGKIITFESDPRFVDDNLSLGLGERVSRIKNAPWGGSTNLFAAMKLILELAVASRLPPEEMSALTFFIFSDMQFDEAHQGGDTVTHHEALHAQYSAEGYPLPRLVYWNLTGSPTQPVHGSTMNSVLLSGTGLGILRSFMCGEKLDLEAMAKSHKEDIEADDAMSEKTPYQTMISVLNLPCFRHIAVLD